MNLPNKLSMARMFLVPVLVVFLLPYGIPFHFLWALLLFMAAAYTDHLDGKLARARGMITPFGQFLDPLADKVLILSAFLCFVKLDFCNIWFVLIILIREFAVTFLRLVAVESGQVIAANRWGKIKTVSQMFSVFCVLLFQALREVGAVSAAVMPVLQAVGNALVGVACLFTVISGVIYLRQNFAVIRDMG